MFHAVMLAKSFYENDTRDDRNAVLHFVLPPEVAAAGHDRMIVNLRPEHTAAW